MPPNSPTRIWRRLARRAFLLLIAPLALGLAGCNEPESATKPTLVIGTYTGFAPVSYKNEERQIVGMDPDILGAFARKHGYELEWREFDFDGLWERPGRGDCDIAACGISKLDSRVSEGTVFSTTYFEVKRSLMIRREDADTLKSIADFQGRSISVTPGSTGESDTRERAPEGARLVDYTDEQAAINDLRSGRIDALARGEVSSRYDASLFPDLAVTDVHPMQNSEYFVYAVRADRPELLAQLDRFLEEAKRSGELLKLTEPYVK